MAGKTIPKRRALEPDETLVEQGAPGDELYLVLDSGVLAVEIDGEEVAEIGPGAIVGERALLEGGTRTATLSARTRCRVAVIPGELIDRQELEDLRRRGGRRARALCVWRRCKCGVPKKGISPFAETNAR